MASTAFHYFSLVGLLSTVADGTLMKVTQLPKHTATKGGSVTFQCGIPYFDSSPRIKVYWWKFGEREYLQTKPDPRKIFGFEQGGSGFFQLLDVNFQDSGVYHCALVLQGKIAANGTGSTLTVCLPPTSLKIIPRFRQHNTPVSLTLVCQTAVYYPKNLTLTWYNNGTEITTGINTTEQQHPDGLYRTSSSLEVAPPVLNGIVYTCTVSHISLQASEIANYTVQLSGESNVPDILLSIRKGNNYWIAGCAGGALIFLIALIIIGKRCQLMKRRDSHKKTNGSHSSGEQGADSITLDLTCSQQSQRPKYQERTAHTQPKGANRNKPTYALMDFSGSKKTGKAKPTNKNTEYGEVKQGVNKLTYAALDLGSSTKMGKPKSNKNTQYAELHIKTTNA